MGEWLSSHFFELASFLVTAGGLLVVYGALGERVRQLEERRKENRASIEQNRAAIDKVEADLNNHEGDQICHLTERSYMDLLRRLSAIESGMSRLEQIMLRLPKRRGDQWE